LSYTSIEIGKCITDFFFNSRSLHYGVRRLFGRGFGGGGAFEKKRGNFGGFLGLLGLRDGSRDDFSA
jgi:hypothetical protein